MDPITLIILGIGSLLAGGAAAAGVYLVYLSYRDVMSWFHERRFLLRYRDDVAATIMNRLASGKYQVVQGVFNLNTQLWSDHRVLEVETVAPELARLHRHDEVVYHHLY